jgi:hypothetical protein
VYRIQRSHVSRPHQTGLAKQSASDLDHGNQLQDSTGLLNPPRRVPLGRP